MKGARFVESKNLGTLSRPGEQESANRQYFPRYLLFPSDSYESKSCTHLTLVEQIGCHILTHFPLTESGVLP